MKKKLLISVLLIAFASVALFFLLSPNPLPPPRVVSTFLGFTNGFTERAAVFSLSNYPDNAIFPHIHEMVCQEDGAWTRRLDPLTNRPALWFAIGGNPEYVMGMAVPITNQPVRIVVGFRRDIGGLRARIDFLAAKLRLRRGTPLFRSPNLFFTNETVVASTAASQP